MAFSCGFFNNKPKILDDIELNVLHLAPAQLAVGTPPSATALAEECKSPKEDKSPEKTSFTEDPLEELARPLTPAQLFEETESPYLDDLVQQEIPSMIDHSLLFPNGTLLNDHELKSFETLKTGHYKKENEVSDKTQRIASPYSITVYRDKLRYAHYNNRGKKEIIGEGGTAKIKAVQNLASRDFDVAKIMKADAAHKSRFYQFALAEVKMLRLLGRAKSGLLIRNNKNDPNGCKYQYCMGIIEGKDVYYHIANDILPYQARKLLEIALDITYLVKFLFDYGFLHRDIKEENFLLRILNDTVEITLIDFAFTLPLNKLGFVYDSNLTGTRSYMAPELLSRRAYSTSGYVYSERTEVYALGKVLRSVLFGIVTFTDEHSQSLVDDVFKSLRFEDDKIVCQKKTTNLQDAEEYEFDRSLYQFICKTMLSSSASRRPSFAEVESTLKEHLAKFPEAKQNPRPVPFMRTLFSHSQYSVTESLLDLLNRGIPVMHENDKNNDGSLKQYLVFDDKSLFFVVKTRLAESALECNIDFRVIENKNCLEIMGKIKIDEDENVVIEEAPRMASKFG